MKSPLGAQGHQGAFEGALPPRGTGALPYIGNAPCDAPTDREQGHAQIDAPRVDPLACPNVIRILLSERASRALSETGQECFAIIGRGSYPSDPARMVIFCQPVPMAVATAACGILAGTHRAQRTRPPATATPKAAATSAPAIVSEATATPAQAATAPATIS